MSSDRLVGRDVGRYHVESLRGVGGMGAVYRARDTKLERTVALKVLPEQRAADEAFRQRFLRESKMLASIDHPNIVPVYEADEADGELYIAMRFVDGPELGDLVRRRGALPPALAVSIISQVADGLDYAHSHGLVHRDVKPANIMIVGGASPDSPVHAYLTDFGLTKIVGEGQGLTETGGFVGTSEYIAPEQIQGKGVDHRADTYSLGCVLYDMLTGAVPFPRDSAHASLWAHVNEPPPRPSRTRSDLPSGFDAVIATAMAKDPNERFQTAGGLAQAAREALASAPVDVAAGAAAATAVLEPRRNASLPTEIRPAETLVPPVAADAAATTDVVPTEVLGGGPSEPSDAADSGATVVAAGAATVLAGGAATVLAGSAGSPTELIVPPGGGNGGGGASRTGGSSDSPPPRRRAGAPALIAAGVAVLVLAGSVLAVGTGAFGLAASATATPAAARASAILPVEPTPSFDLTADVVPSSDPSASASDDPPVPSGDPTAKPTPAPTPVRTPRPTPRPDTTGPTGGKVRLAGGKSVTTALKVPLGVVSRPSDASKVNRIIWSLGSSRPSGDGKAYPASSYSVSLADKTAGTQYVYVWFRDSAGNWSAKPIRDAITFDHAPVIDNSVVFSPTFCDGDHKLDLLATPRYVATDRDGQSTLKVVKVWNGATDLSGGISSDGLYVTIHVKNLAGTGDYTFTDNFTVQDGKGVKRSGHFKMAFKGC